MENKELIYKDWHTSSKDNVHYLHITSLKTLDEIVKDICELYLINKRNEKINKIKCQINQS